MNCGALARALGCPPRSSPVLLLGNIKGLGTTFLRQPVSLSHPSWTAVGGGEAVVVVLVLEGREGSTRGLHEKEVTDPP
ncbi:hypothetical protein FQA47_015921 [Oryzias melastigma]|uniref:Uncharacterized protein n=1 Tax=Oryzias melastigma TaxID=30732 RepID=A0A834C1K1_ORYME|nr:hypothetical protein FQA47_015921 [Oryzias melastigma]